MSTKLSNPIAENELSDLRWKSLYRFGGAAALVQLVCTLVTLIVVITLGVEPATAEEYYTVLGQDRIVGLLRLDFASLVNVTLYAATAISLYFALRRIDEAGAFSAVAFILVGVSLALAAHSAFSMMHLSDQYAAAASEAHRVQLLTAGEAVIAADWWHSTGGFMAGLFMQGGAVAFSIVMLRSGRFGKVTAYSGMLSNGLDFAHVLVGLFFPAAGVLLLSIGGLFYLVWFPALGRDLLRLGRRDARGAEELKMVGGVART